MWNNSFSLKVWNVDTASSSFDLLYCFQKSNGLIYWWRFSFHLIGALWGFVDATKIHGMENQSRTFVLLCYCMYIHKVHVLLTEFYASVFIFWKTCLIEIKSELFNKMHVSSCSFNMKSVIELEDWMAFSYRDSYIVWSAKRLPRQFCRTFEEVCSVPLEASKHPIVWMRPYFVKLTKLSQCNPY